jgi:hypothetical protein
MSVRKIRLRLRGAAAALAVASLGDATEGGTAVLSGGAEEAAA